MFTWDHLAGFLHAHSDESTLFSAVFFPPLLNPFCATTEKMATLKKKKIFKKETFVSFFPLLQMPPEPLLLSPSSFSFSARNKVTTLSKGCMIRQSAVVAGPCGCCQARLCTTASAGEIYPVCFGTVANMFLFLSRYAPSLPRKKNNIFTDGEEERH